MWPLGLPSWRVQWIAAGRRVDSALLVAAWRRGGEPKITLPLPAWLGPDPTVEVLYPRWGNDLVAVSTQRDGTTLDIALPGPNSARLFRISLYCSGHEVGGLLGDERDADLA